MRPRRPTRLGAASALAVAAAMLGGCAGATRPTFERFDPTVTPRAEDHPDVPAIVLLDRGLLTFGVDRERGVPFARLRRYRRVKVLRPAGRSQARITVPYDPRAIVRHLRARTVQPNGDVRESRGDVVDTTFDGRPAKGIAVANVDVGTVVEHVYDLYADDLRFLAPWRFQGELPTVRSAYAVIVPEGFEVDLRFSRDGAFVDRPPERFDIEGGVRYSWTLSNLPPQFPEPDMPAPALLAPRAHVLFRSARQDGVDGAGFESWDAVAAWHLARLPGWSTLSAATAEEARRVAGGGDPVERALKITEVVARDLAPAPPTPLWRSSIVHPDFTLTAQRADATNRGMLLVALLRAAGLSAVPALYAYADRDVLLPDAPTVRALDGVAAVIPRPGGPLVLDPGQATVSGEVPAPRLQGARIVLARTDGAEIMRVARSAPEDSRCAVDLELQMRPGGALHGRLEARLTGAEAGALRAVLLAADPADYASLAQAFLHERGAPLPLETVSIADLKALRRPLVLRGRLRAADAVEDEGTDVFVPIGRLLGAPRGGLRPTRRSPLLLGAPRSVELRGTLTLPEGYELDVIPPVVEEGYDGTTIRIEARAETRRRIGFFRSERSSDLVVPVRRYPGYVAFRRAVQAAEDQVFSVRRPPDRPLDY